MNSTLRDKSTLFYSLQIESEKVVKELNRVKAEISETISQKQLLKEANIRLTSQLEATVEDSNVSLRTEVYIVLTKCFIVGIIKLYIIFVIIKFRKGNALIILPLHKFVLLKINFKLIYIVLNLFIKMLVSLF